MRKMNKIVALSLVLAMALSMMASAASFKDQATINADLMDEINLLVALGVYSEQGTGAGNFEPNGTITRSMAAKMFYVLKNKGVDNGAASWTGMNIFSDVEAGSWYEGYVNYCASTGLIAGTGDGYFNPNGQLTGTELAKLCLVLIGYKADVEGYTGAKWAENIIADAENAGILDGYELPVKGVATREWAAEMIVNAIKDATKVKYEDGEAVEQFGTSTIMQGDLQEGFTSITTSTPITYANQDLGLVETVGQLTATPNIKLNEGANNEDGENVYSEVAGIKFEYDADPALLGQKVTVLSKGALNEDAKVYGVTAHADVKVVDTTVDALKYSRIADNKTHANITVGSYTKKIELAKAPLTVYVDYVANEAAAWGGAAEDAVSTSASKIFDGSAAGANDNREVKMIDNNGDGIWDIAMMNHVEYGVVDKINASKNTLKVNELDKFDLTFTNDEEAWDAINFVDTVAVDDVIKVSKDFSTGEEILVVELADVVTGVVTKVVDTTITIDGETIKKASAAVAIDANVGVDSDAQDLYTDGKYVVYVRETASSNEDQVNIAMLVQAAEVNDGWSTTNKVDILKNDGTREKLTYVSDSSLPEGDNVLKFSDIKGTKDVIFEYVMKSGKVYFKTLADVEDGDIDVVDIKKGIKIDISENEATVGTSEYLTNDDTYFFVKDNDGDYAVVMASELLGDITNAKDVDSKLGVSASGLPYIKYGVMILKGDLPSAETSSSMGIAASVTGTELDDEGNTIYTLNVTKLDGSVITLKSENKIDSAACSKFVKYSIGSDGMVEKIDSSKSVISDNKYVRGTVTAIDGMKVVINGKMYDLTEDTTMYFVNSYKNASDNKAKTSVAVLEEEDMKLVLAAEDDNDQTIEGGVFFIANADDEIEKIIIEVDGEFIYTNGSDPAINEVIK